MNRLGFFKNANGHSQFRKCAEEYNLHYCLDGKGVVSTVYGNWNIQKGDAFFLEKDQEHQYLADADSPWSIYYAHFDGEGVPKLYEQLGVSNKSPVFHIGEIVNIQLVMDEMIECLSKGYSSIKLLYCATSDADTYECKNGCLAKKNKVRKNGSIGYSFYRSDCEKCPFAKECLGNTNDGYKQILQNVNHEIFEEQRIFEATEHFKEKHKIRWKIEQRNSHLKKRYGLNKTYGTGLCSMKAQSFLTAFTANIIKITKLVATI